MDIKIKYSLVSLEEAVKFISKHNPSFLGKNQVIKKTILDHMKRLAKQHDSTWSATMGYLLLVIDREVEGLDSDVNEIEFEIYVRPDIGISQYVSSEYTEEIYHV